MTYKTICKCDHDLESHYKDPNGGKRITCLSRGCECKAYRDGLAPDPPPQPRAPILPPPLDPPEASEAPDTEPPRPITWPYWP